MNQENPYLPPETQPTELPAQMGKIYSQNQVLAATFFGSLICGALLLKHNFMSKQERFLGNIVFYGSIAVIVLFIAITWNISERANSLVSKLFIAVGMLAAYLIYNSKLRSAFNKHRKKGGAIMSNWMVVLAILKVIGVFFLLIVGWVGYEVFINGEEL